MSGPRFTSFVVLAEMRTGSNLLQAQLNRVPGLRCHGELFNPAFIDEPGTERFLGLDKAARDADPLGLLSRLGEGGALTGFRLFGDHDPEVIAACLADPARAKIVLGRNAVDSFISLGIARQTGQWVLGPGRARRRARVRFDPAEFAAFLARRDSFRRAVMGALQTTGQTAFVLDYEDLGRPEVIAGLVAFLGLPPPAPEVLAAPVALRRQNPEPAEAKVDNPAEMARALSRIDWCGLADAQGAPPRSRASVADAVIAARAPLLWLPVAGAVPRAAVADWLARIGAAPRGGGVLAGFGPRVLGRWLDRHAGRRSVFTIIDHPLPRAHRAFAAAVIGGDAPALGALIRRRAGIAPDDPSPFDDPARHRAAFAAWLQHAAEGGLGMGEAALPQAELIAGLSRIAMPDRILRTDRIARDLAALARAHDLPDPGWIPLPPDPADLRLAEIRDSEIDGLAAQLLWRDLRAFGFAGWEGPQAA
jgi:LPS sulfotransferase NodH